MSQSSRVRDDVTEPLVPIRSSQLRLLFSLFANEAFSIAKISFPLVLTGLFLYLRSFFTLYLLGSLGDAKFAAGCLAFAIANITGYSVVSGLTMGVESLCSQAFGAKRYNYFRATIKRGIILLFFTSLLVTLLWINMAKVLEMMGQDKDSVFEAHTILLYSVPDLIAQSFLHPLRVYLRTQSNILPLSVCTLIASLLHLPVTFYLVSYLGLGIKGLALSGFVSNFNLVVFLFLYITFFDEKLSNDEENLDVSFKDSKEWKKLFCLAIPSGLLVCLEWSGYEIMILVAGILINPEANVATMGILIQLTSLVYIFPSSLSFGVSTRVGNALGSNQPQKARRAAIVGLGLSIAFGFTALFFTVSVRNVWAKLFTNDTEIISLTSMALPIVGLCELGNCPQTTGCGILRGTARPKIGAYLNLVAFYAVGMPVGGILAFWFGLGLNGLWLGMLAAQLTCVISMMVAISRINWELEAGRAKELTSVDGGSGSGSDNDND